MRAILVDWLVDVHYRYKQQPETLHLCINLIDRYLAARPVERSRLQLVGIASLLVASKFEEAFRSEVTVADMVYVCDRAYSADDIRAMECSLLGAIRFGVSAPTGYTFLTRCIQVQGLDPAGAEAAMGSFLLERTLQEYHCLVWPPSQLAAAAANLAAWVFRPRVMAGGCWDLWVADDVGYTERELEGAIVCLEALLQAPSQPPLADANNPLPNVDVPLVAVTRKFSSSRQHSVALMEISRPR